MDENMEVTEVTEQPEQAETKPSFDDLLKDPEYQAEFDRKAEGMKKKWEARLVSSRQTTATVSRPMLSLISYANRRTKSIASFVMQEQPSGTDSPKRRTATGMP